MKKINDLLVIWVLFVFTFSCSDNQINETDDINDENLKNDFFIEGVVENKLLRYPQVNFEWTNVSNKYFIEYQETWLQAYIDSTDLGAGYWKIRIHKIDISNVELPYTLGGSDGSVRWFDSGIDDIIETNPNCQGVDSGCTFVLSASENEITITSVENNIIEGKFSGKAVIVGTGFTPYRDTSLFHNIVNGQFRIKFRTE